MTTVFADAFYYFALVNPGDDRHQQAREFTANFTGKVYPFNWKGYVPHFGSPFLVGSSRSMAPSQYSRSSTMISPPYPPDGR